MEASVFETSRPRSASRAQACITIFLPRQRWLLLSPNVTESDSLLQSRYDRMKAPKTLYLLIGRRSGRHSPRTVGCVFAVCSAQRRELWRRKLRRRFYLSFAAALMTCRDELAPPEQKREPFHVMATLEGAMMLARAYRSVEVFDQAV